MSCVKHSIELNLTQKHLKLNSTSSFDVIPSISIDCFSHCNKNQNRYSMKQKSHESLCLKSYFSYFFLHFSAYSCMHKFIVYSTCLIVKASHRFEYHRISMYSQNEYKFYAISNGAQLKVNTKNRHKCVQERTILNCIRNKAQSISFK